MPRLFSSLLITGGAGFIGSNLIRYILQQPTFTGRIVNLDCLTYAGSRDNVHDIEEEYGPDRYLFEPLDICNSEVLSRCFEQHKVDAVIHLAAETHVDRSIENPQPFIETNIQGTFNLLQAAVSHWEPGQGHFHHVSTDEVFGPVCEGESIVENRYAPSSPYAASKAAADHLVGSWHKTYGLPVTLSHSSNTFGPYQLAEKLIPLMITRMLNGQSLPIYGDGQQVRDWLYVEDHCRAVWEIIQAGKVGENYPLCGGNPWSNTVLVDILCELVAQHTGCPVEEYKRLKVSVTDRPGHDQGYGLTNTKISAALGWKPSTPFEQGLAQTVQWYLARLL